MREQTPHTPGPWRSFEAGSEGAYIKRATGDSRFDLRTIAAVTYGETLTAFANARLIAAAPDMLEALQRVWVWADSHEDIDDEGRPNDAMRVKGMICDVITQATGGAE